jgi:hypothetical protein
MKVLSLLLGIGLIVVEPMAGFGQVAPPVVQPRPQVTQKAPPLPAPELETLTRFDLDFPGGPPRQLVAAISKATGKHLNVIIPARNADVQIMPIKVENVTVRELFRAIQTASAREVPIVTAVGPGNQKAIQYKNSSLSFQQNSEPTTDETVWSFISTGPTEEDNAVLTAAAQPEEVCQYFQLARYLEDHSVEDITTAIQTGWKMLHIDPVPQLSFHKETKLLIAVGPKDQISMIPQVLEQLHLDATAGLEKLAKLQKNSHRLRRRKRASGRKKRGVSGSRSNTWRDCNAPGNRSRRLPKPTPRLLSPQ